MEYNGERKGRMEYNGERKGNWSTVPSFHAWNMPKALLLYVQICADPHLHLTGTAGRLYAVDVHSVISSASQAKLFCMCLSSKLVMLLAIAGLAVFTSGLHKINLPLGLAINMHL
jgi:hypothetical protein